jgi:hypothetical protein
MSDEVELEQRLLERELAEFLPKAGDRLFVASAAGAHVDPLGFSAAGEKRSSIGRWQLYSSGFLHAGDRLVDSTSGAPHEDELIYPILALYRHHLELELKYATRYYSRDANLRGWLTEKHSLIALWQKLSEIYPRFGEWASEECTKACFALLSEFDGHDPNSQGFRYPEDKRGDPTLIQLSVIDLRSLKLGVHKVAHYVGTIVEQIGEDRDWEAEMASW